MKNKVAKIIFIVSFLPCILILIYATICAISGVTFLGSESYGVGAFVFTVAVFFAFFAFKIPIIPCCIIYQFYYILRKRNKETK